MAFKTFLALLTLLASSLAQTNQTQYDVLIIGGGPSGLSAASGLSRVLRKVALFDSGDYRNNPTRHMHDVIGSDHVVPAEFRAAARAQISFYNVTTFIDTQVTSITATGSPNGTSSFTATLANGTTYTGRKVILGSGLKDALPENVPGLREAFGKGLYWCPWCDGFEHREQPVGVIGNFSDAYDSVRELHPTLNREIRVFANGTANDTAQLARIRGKNPDWQAVFEAYNVTVNDKPILNITRVQDGAQVQEQAIRKELDVFRVYFTDGSFEECGAIMANYGTYQASALPAQMGVRMLGGKIDTTAPGLRTTVKGVWGVGDANSDNSTNVPHAMSSGKRAAVYCHVEMASEELAQIKSNSTKRQAVPEAPIVEVEMGTVRDPTSRGSYTVAWICALEEEYFVACRMLDEEFYGPDVDEEHDDNTYAYGRIFKHYVVIGCLPAGSCGTNSAARVARDMVRTFPRLRFALMVGIGGGAPSARNDIRLGDVVVSEPKDGFGGVFQYDMAKLKDGRFQRTGALNAPPEKLLGVIPELRRLHADRRKPDRLAEHLQLLNDMPEYQKPAAADRLYAVGCPHAGGESCDNCDETLIVNRPERQTYRAIQVHYGTIASGNLVLKDSIVRQSYAGDPELNILCFEMEAAGLMNNIPSLVIRGICDYCDSHKNDVWHKYAASVAAAYARELLMVLRPQRVEAIPPWADRVAQGLQDVSQKLSNLGDTQKNVLTAVETLDENIHSAKLPVVEDAAVDSFVNQHQEGCLPGTRISLLNDISRWALSADDKCIFWLNGMAGTGKSTISRTVARMLREKKFLGASYFFKRGEGDQGNAKKFFPTLVQQLMGRFPMLKPSLSKTLRDNPDVTSKSLREQFDVLLLQPLKALDEASRRSQPTVIVIDALDECEDEYDTKSIIRLLPLLQKAESIRLRIFVTSRPEVHIKLGFSEIKDHQYQDLVLHDIAEELTESDINLYFEHQFVMLKRDRNILDHWPTCDTIKELVRISAPLFISAATICRYIQNSRLDPKLRLAELLKDQSKYVSRMDKIYLPILTRLISDNKNDAHEQQHLVEEFQTIVGTIVLLVNPLSITTLSSFLKIDADRISDFLDSFQSVLNVPEHRNSPVRILHLSFRDFLTQSDTRFSVNQRKRHSIIAKCCLRVMRSNLRRNICNLAGPAISRMDIDPDTIKDFIPPELEYSCRHWIQHIERSESLLTEGDDILLFLQTHFLHWLEVMSLLGLISEVVPMLDSLGINIDGIETRVYSSFLYDSKRFVLKNLYILDQAPLQSYYSGLLFAPKKSIIRNHFKEYLPRWIHSFPQVDDEWSAELHTLEGHLDSVGSLAFSPNGRLLASGSRDDTVKIWDLVTGATIHILHGHWRFVTSVAFSPDGERLASGSSDGTVCLWDPITGIQLRKLQVISNDITAFIRNMIQSVTFSADGSALATSTAHAIRFWDLATGDILDTIESTSNDNFTGSLAISPDGLVLASGTKKGLIQLWDTITGTELDLCQGHEEEVISVAFSPSGQLLASIGSDYSLRLWDAEGGVLSIRTPNINSIAFSPDGQLLALSSHLLHTVYIYKFESDGTLQDGALQTLQKFQSSPLSVAFSPDSQLLACGLANGMIRLLDPGATRSQQPTSKDKSNGTTAVALSADGSLLASGSWCYQVRLWDPKTGNELKVLKSHTHDISWSLAFSHDSRLLASCGSNSIWLWDLKTGELLRTFRPKTTTTNAQGSVVFSADGRLLASRTGVSRTVNVWDTVTGTHLHTLFPHDTEYSRDMIVMDRLRTVVFSLDNHLLAACDSDRRVLIWDIAAGGILLSSKANDTTSNNLVSRFEQGALYIKTDCSHPNSYPKTEAGIFLLENGWVSFKGQRVLWLPPEARSTSPEIIDNILVLGHKCGRLSFTRFEQSLMALEI
ncbi:hypothetical protein BJX64DRAFT_294281 [Aspergillus heterothallicus]